MATRIMDELHNTPQEVRAWLGTAIAICEDAYDGDTAPDLVLVKVLELLASRTIQFGIAQPTTIDPALARTLGLGGGRH